MGLADIVTISRGQPVSLESHLSPGKLVVFEFHATWCGPCLSLAPRLRALAENHPERLAIRRVDIGQWGTPVARQHGIRSVPHLVVYCGDGQRLQAGGAEILATLARHLETPARPSGDERRRRLGPLGGDGVFPAQT